MDDPLLENLNLHEKDIHTSILTDKYTTSMLHNMYRNYKLKTDRPHPHGYPHTPTDY